MHIACGLCMGPTLDGHAAGQTLADSPAGSQGVAELGPTAQIRSVCRLHSRLVGGTISTLQLSPSEFASPESRAKVVSLIRSFVAMGGSQLPTSRTRCGKPREIQSSTGVCSSGWPGTAPASPGSAEPLQDEIIARTEGVDEARLPSQSP